MTDDIERINADFITLARNDFYKKVNELRNAEIVFYDNQNLLGESEFLEFGYKHQNGNTVHTVADFGCIWKHFECWMLELRDIVRADTIQELLGRDDNVDTDIPLEQFEGASSIIDAPEPPFDSDNTCTAGILNANGDYIGPCGKPWPCKDHNGYVG